MGKLFTINYTLGSPQESLGYVALKLDIAPWLGASIIGVLVILALNLYKVVR